MDLVLVMGDLNITMRENEKSCGLKDLNCMTKVKRLLQSKDLKDVKTLGQCFTWWDRQESVNSILARLDRALVNPLWLENFPNVFVINLKWNSSDHILIVLCQQPSHTRKKAMYGFVNY